ncbi:reverse transcriptase [Gossypium australe]|uniref:Reverse transcriptase n=1 Tax=Gossypium australe TaxID=47621 RepID=A0A5B6WF44_9ROSI|nr:reverse transcriptase [Gossypium australe]
MRILCWNCRGIENPAMVRKLKQLLVVSDLEVIFLCETKVHTNKFVSIRSKCRMEGCLAVNAINKSGGLVMMWKEGIKVEIKNYSNNHIDSLVHLDNDKSIRFMGFYGNADPNKRQSSWDMLRKLSLVDLKMDKGWYTWVNNREGDALVKERLDCFLISSNNVACFPFMETKVIRQSTSDHDIIFLDTKGRKLRERTRDPRLNFRYDVCWAKENKVKHIIKNVWQNGDVDVIGKIKKVGQDLGVWQYNRYKNMLNQIGTLQVKINRTIDSLGSTSWVTGLRL